MSFNWNESFEIYAEKYTMEEALKSARKAEMDGYSVKIENEDGLYRVYAWDMSDRERAELAAECGETDEETQARALVGERV